MTTMPEVVLRAIGLRKDFVRGGFLAGERTILRAVDDVSLELRAGQTLGLVGESGSGKSTLGKCLLRLEEPTSGAIHLHGEDITGASPREMRRLRTKLRMVFQDPYSSLNPRMTIGDIVSEPLRIHRVHRRRGLDREVARLFDRCGLSPEWRRRYPHELSGGQRQRVGIARALSLSPDVLIADEPVSALDVSVQASILNLLVDLQRDMGFACLFISHDLGVVEYVSDHTAVMYLGQIVESGSTKELFRQPRHPYTQALLSATLPLADEDAEASRIVLQGDLPSPVSPPSGCRFHTRCPIAADICTSQVPPLVPRLGDAHPVACHFVDDDGRPPELPAVPLGYGDDDDRAAHR
jgi:oligopeptide transport system ATP-binding protein